MILEFERTKEQSSNIAHVKYDQDSQTLRVKFHNGGVYDYHEVPEVLYIQFEGERSAGSFLNLEIKKTFRFTPNVEWDAPFGLAA